MAQKNKGKALTPEQIAILKREKLSPLCWTVLQDLPSGMTVKHIITGTVKHISK